MEYLEGGSLQDLIKQSPSNLDEASTQWILREMLKVSQALMRELCTAWMDHAAC